MDVEPLIFISYSHKDEREKNIFVSHLGVLQNLGLVSLWDSTQIAAGDNWQAKIEQAINRAKIAILLISPGYLASSFLVEKEVPSFFKRREQEEGLVIIPVIIKPCPWTEIDWLARMQVLPRDGRPIWGEDGDAQEQLVGVVNEIVGILGTSKDRPFIERDFVPELITVKSGEADLIASGTAIQFGNNPIEIYFGREPIKFIFSFSDEKSQSEIPVTAKLIDHKTVSLSIFKARSPLLPQGTIKPFPLGVFNNRRLYLHFRVRDFPSGDNTLEYNIYLGEETS